MEEIYTVDRLLNEAMSLMGEEQKYKKDYTPFATDLVNNLIADCFVINNTMREAAGLEPLEEFPVMEGLDSEVPYEYECLKNIMTYGLAFWLLYQDGENDKANMQNAVYEENKARFAKARYDDIAMMV